ncbi:MAG: oligopeptide/dipeptide ABC transporter ATP-binding protein [Myxococcota bacterium]
MTATTPEPTPGSKTIKLEPLIALRQLKVHFPVHVGRIFQRRTGTVRAVDGIDLEIFPGETLGLVGESGCGKSTTGRAILQLYPPGIAEITGEVVYRGKDLVRLGATASGQRALRPLRRDLQIIFQDPYASLNPRMTVGQILAEPLKIHGLAAGASPGQSERQVVEALLETVGLSPSMASRYPHEFSGGQRQRIGVARALALRPKFIVCDEPISALDVSIQAQIMNLMDELQARLALTYLFIAHDLAAVRHISDRIAVMYLGQIVEIAPAKDVYDRPLHPYTQALISAVPVPDPSQRGRQRIRLEGEIPNPLSPPSGCRFHNRCRYVEADCRTMEPQLVRVESGHQVACHVVARGERFPVRVVEPPRPPAPPT